MSNALKAARATNNETLELTVSFENVDLEGKQYLEIRIGDNGVGIKGDRRFFTSDLTHLNQDNSNGYGNKKIESIGVGMASLAEGAREVGGVIYLENRTDKRGTYSVLLVPEYIPPDIYQHPDK